MQLLLSAVISLALLLSIADGMVMIPVINGMVDVLALCTPLAEHGMSQLTPCFNSHALSEYFTIMLTKASIEAPLTDIPTGSAQDLLKGDVIGNLIHKFNDFLDSNPDLKLPTCAFHLILFRISLL